MAVNNLIYENECGLPLNSIEWLEIHHRSKSPERTRMVRDLHIERGSHLVDAGCGPGLWTPMLAHAVGPEGRITGVDISIEALVTAHRRSQDKWYAPQLRLKQGTLEHLPVQPGSLQMIFSANVSQYLPDPISTFAAMGRCLAPSGRLAVKDIDFGTMRFSNIDAGLQARVLRAREQWEQLRIAQGYAFEDSWVGSKLAGYLRAAGYQDVQERRYRIVRRFPLSPDFRFYLQGIAGWFVSEGGPLLAEEDRNKWLECFFDERRCVLDSNTFTSEETEFVVTGVWRGPENTSLRYFDMQAPMLEAVAV
ncbi:MAG TPA: methyltransferase domain-containing protein [Ktedonobacteraceae bacterium]|jgi:ubiquinone/menaquinone biosynthesis C-methylase UbiE|nr:methyltransferase domain-containing protein [Ktedonobacteraceae bacterium]